MFLSCEMSKTPQNTQLMDLNSSQQSKRARKTLEHPTSSTSTGDESADFFDTEPPYTPPLLDLLCADSRPEVDEISPSLAFTDDENALNGFVNLHPMLSGSLLGPEVLQCLGEITTRRPIQLESLPIVGKSYEDSFLRPPVLEAGERPCINNADCLSVLIARLRHGVDTTLAFTCTEFLLPKQQARFLQGSGLPQQRNKCLICLRYYVTFIYLMARSDRSFRTNTSAYGMQTHSNPCGSCDTEPTMSQHAEDNGGGSARASGSGDTMEKPTYREGSPTTVPTQPQSCTAPVVDDESTTSSNKYEVDDTSGRISRVLQQKSLPLHSNTVGVNDGYLQSAMLFADEEYAQTHVMRTTVLGQLMWRPFVRFCSTHYRYTTDEDGRPRVVQCGIGANEHLNDCAPSMKVGWMVPGGH